MKYLQIPHLILLLLRHFVQIYYYFRWIRITLTKKWHCCCNSRWRPWRQFLTAACIYL